jgi:hypothetical protein
LEVLEEDIRALHETTLNDGILVHHQHHHTNFYPRLHSLTYEDKSSTVNPPNGSAHNGSAHNGSAHNGSARDVPLRDVPWRNLLAYADAVSPDFFALCIR